MNSEMEKRHKEEEMERLREEANKKLLEIRNSCIRDLEILRKKSSISIFLATTEHEMNEINRYVEEEMQRITERQIRESKEVNQKFLKDLMSI